MDMGVAGRKAIVCGASKGLGKGCALALAREGVVLGIVTLEDVLEELVGVIRDGAHQETVGGGGDAG